MKTLKGTVRASGQAEKGNAGGSPAKPEKIARVSQGGVTCIFPVGCDVLAWPTGDDGSSETCRLLDATPAGALVECKSERIMVPWWYVEPRWNSDAGIEAEIVTASGARCAPSRRNETDSAPQGKLTGDMDSLLAAIAAIREQVAEGIRHGGMNFRGMLQDLSGSEGLQKIADHLDEAAIELGEMITEAAYPFIGDGSKATAETGSGAATE